VSNRFAAQMKLWWNSPGLYWVLGGITLVILVLALLVVML
jgi:hypothetical protein